MYIPEFWCGAAAATLVQLAFWIVIALIVGRKNRG